LKYLLLTRSPFLIKSLKVTLSTNHTRRRHTTTHL